MTSIVHLNKIHPPVASAGQDFEATIAHDCGQTNTVEVNLNGIAFDIDGDPLICEWIHDENIVSNDCDYTFDQSEGTEYYELRVTDCYGESDIDTVSVRINPEPNNVEILQTQVLI